MFTELGFKNFRALKDARLSLGPLTLLVGPNGSGKTSVLESLRWAAGNFPQASEILSIDTNPRKDSAQIAYSGDTAAGHARMLWQFSPTNGAERSFDSVDGYEAFRPLLSGIRHYAFESAKMRAPVVVTEHRQLAPDGSNLAGFLDYIRDNGSDAFSAFVEGLHRTIPEYDDVGFDGAGEGKKTFKLRRTGTKHFVPARLLSEGTLYVVALLAMVHQPDLPTVLCLEEPDRGLHPRLYREIKEALYRLAYPADYGENREPVQVVATTHSAHFLNEFSDHPDQIVVCEKGADHNVTFRNLCDDPKAREILGESLIGDAWATGALGGVPLAPLV